MISAIFRVDDKKLFWDLRNLDSSDSFKENLAELKSLTESAKTANNESWSQKGETKASPNFRSELNQHKILHTALHLKITWHFQFKSIVRKSINCTN